MTEPVERERSSGCYVGTPALVYAWTRTKEEFDSIALPETVHAWKANETVTLLRADGREWEQRVTSKALDGGPVSVVFQWFDERPILADNG